STRDRSRADDSPIRAGYEPSSAINADSSLIQIQALEGVTSAAVAPAGGVLSGQVAWIDLLQGAHEEIVYAAGVAVDGRLGQAVAGSRAATIAMLRRTLEDARLLRGRSSAYERRQLRDLAADAADLEALFPVLDKKIPLTLRANRVSDLLAALKLAKDFDLRLVILGGAEGWKVREALADAGVTVIVQPSSNLPQSFDSLGSRLENAALLHAAGVTVGIAVLGDPHNVRNARQEAGIAASYGLPREVAVAAMTKHIAEAYGMEQSHGSLEPGKVANVVVWSGDPLELASWPEAVIIRGEQVPLVSRQSELRDRYLRRLRATK
ncbi:MAG: amidohydrolase family protein, partial [Nannocystaceae bacterium]